MAEMTVNPGFEEKPPAKSRIANTMKAREM